MWNDRSPMSRVAHALTGTFLACIFALGIAVATHPGDHAPSAINKLYDPTDL